QYGTNTTSVIIEQADLYHAEALIRFRVSFVQTARNGFYFSSGLFFSDLGLQARNNCDSMMASVLQVSFGHERQGQPDIGPYRKLFVQNTDHGEALITNLNIFPDDAEIGAKAPNPEAMAQASHSVLPRLIFLRRKIAAILRSDSHQ